MQGGWERRRAQVPRVADPDDCARLCCPSLQLAAAPLCGCHDIRLFTSMQPQSTQAATSLLTQAL
eukprot:1760880-Pleurochrysis_carterae.AAC.1